MKNNTLKFLFFVSIFVTSINAEFLSFTKAYDLALKNSHKIKSSQYQAESSKEKAQEVKAGLFPQINFFGSYKKAEYEQNNQLASKIKQGLFNGTLSLDQSIYNPELYSKINMESTRSELSKSKVELEKTELAQKVFEAYLNLLKSKNKIDLTKSYMEYNRLRLEALKKKYDMRLANKMDLLEMQVEYNSVSINLARELKLKKVYELKLKQLIGNEDFELSGVRYDVDIFDTISKMTNFIKNNSDITNNLKISQSNIALKLSEYTVNNSFNAHLPRLDFQASISIYDTDTPTIDAPYSDVSQAMIVLNIPIFSGGMTNSRVKSAKLMNKAAQEDMLNMEKEIDVEYSEKKAVFDSSVESVSMYQDAFLSAQLYVNSVEQGYSHGLKSITDLNDAKNKLYEVKYKYVENIFEVVNSYIGLLIVTNNFDNIGLLDQLLKVK